MQNTAGELDRADPRAEIGDGVERHHPGRSDLSEPTPRLIHAALRIENVLEDLHFVAIRRL